MLLSVVEVIASLVAGLEPARGNGADADTVKARSPGPNASAVPERHWRPTGPPCPTGTRCPGTRTPPTGWPGSPGSQSETPAGFLRLGKDLESQPGVEEAYRSVNLSRTGATLVAGAVTGNLRSEDELLAVAQRDTQRRLKDQCLKAKARGRSKVDAARACEAIRQSRKCRTWTDAEGAFRLDATLTTDACASLLASLTTRSNRFFHRARRAGLHESRDAFAADALVALVTGRGTSGPESGVGTGPRAGAGSGASFHRCGHQQRHRGFHHLSSGAIHPRSLEDCPGRAGPGPCGARLRCGRGAGDRPPVRANDGNGDAPLFTTPE
jgi:hypothetical protein